MITGRAARLAVLTAVMIGAGGALGAGAEASDRGPGDDPRPGDHFPMPEVPMPDVSDYMPSGYPAFPDPGTFRTPKAKDFLPRAAKSDGRRSQGNTGIGNVGESNPGIGNVGSRNPGVGNVGARNPGIGNVGKGNSGIGNVGLCNSGIGNVGDRNPGIGNVGSRNSGIGNVDAFTLTRRADSTRECGSTRPPAPERPADRGSAPREAAAELPRTGGDDTLPITLAGLGLVALGGLAWWLSQSRYRRDSAAIERCAADVGAPQNW